MFLGDDGGSQKPMRVAIGFWVGFKRFLPTLTLRSELHVSESNRGQRLCATTHKVVSFRDIKRTEGAEHSPVLGGGCSGER